MKRVEGENVVILGSAFKSWPMRSATAQYEFGYTSLLPHHFIAPNNPPSEQVRVDWGIHWNGIEAKRKVQHEEERVAKKTRLEWDSMSPQDQKTQVMIQQTNEQAKIDTWKLKQDSIRSAAVKKRNKQLLIKCKRVNAHARRIEKIRAAAGLIFDHSNEDCDGQSE